MSAFDPKRTWCFFDRSDNLLTVAEAVKLHAIKVFIFLLLITSPAYARGGGPSNNSHVTASSSSFRPAKGTTSSATIRKNTGILSSKAGKVKSDQNKIDGQTKTAKEKADAAKNTSAGEASLEYLIGNSNKLQSGDHQQQLKQMENNLQQLKTEKRTNRLKRCDSC